MVPTTALRRRYVAAVGREEGTAGAWERTTRRALERAVGSVAIGVVLYNTAVIYGLPTGEFERFGPIEQLYGRTVVPEQRFVRQAPRRTDV